jgi:hypothetical protein
VTITPGDAVRITIDVPEPLADQLSREAAQAGLPLAQHVIRLLANRRVAATHVPSLTGVELVAYWNREGIIGSRSDIDDPVEFSRTLRTRNQTRLYPPY